VNESLNREMELVMKLASLGHSARNQAAIKVRQPLSEAAFSVAKLDEAHAVALYGDLLADELNVKVVRTLGSAGEAVSYSLNPLPKQLGQKYKSEYPAIRNAILGLEPEQTARALLAGSPIQVPVNGKTYEILPEEVEVRLEARSGLTVASDGPYLCALKIDLTPELVSEGLAREFVRRVQDLRKQAEFDIADRIRLFFQATPKLAGAVEAYRDYVMGETLTVELVAAQPPHGAHSTTVEFDGEQVTIGVQKV